MVVEVEIEVVEVEVEVEVVEVWEEVEVEVDKEEEKRKRWRFRWRLRLGWRWSLRWSLVKLYAPRACFLFFGIFQEYSMEYSIFQNFQYFGCFAIFLEYSKSIFQKTY